MITRSTKKFWAAWILLLSPLVKTKKGRPFFVVGLIVLIAGFFVPQDIVIPVKGATVNDWNPKSFWAYPWGTSITHKGIDIFKDKGTPVLASTYGMVIYTHEGGKGGRSVMILGPKWRFHYYAHLDQVDVFPFKPIKINLPIGTVGDTGNAKGKPPHLHYEIVSPFPDFSQWDNEAIQGWKKIFYVNPDTYFRSSSLEKN